MSALTANLRYYRNVPVWLFRLWRDREILRKSTFYFYACKALRPQKKFQGATNGFVTSLKMLLAESSILTDKRPSTYL